MNKLVYLFELDSVRKTDKEIHEGQLAMYDELVGNGNTIAMSMNQITDSKTFLCMLQDNEHYDIIKRLVENKCIKVSRYGEIRTVSQYVQNAINRNLEKNEDVFIFSALPVKSNQKLLLKLMQKVLLNADLSIIEEYIKFKSNDQIVQLFNEYNTDGTIKKTKISIDRAKDYLKFLYRFLEMTISISMNGELAIPAIKYDETYKQKSFFDIMNEIISFDCDKNQLKLWDETINILNEIKNQFVRDSENKKNNRSVWIKKIKALEGSRNKENLQYAELIVDLCYNYTIELSICGVSKHYERDGHIESFKQEFFSRLKYDWNDGQDAEHRFLQEETNEYTMYKHESINWEHGLRMILRNKKLEKDSEKVDDEHNNKENEKIKLYEWNYESERKKEKGKDFVNIFKAITITLIYSILLYFMDSKISLLQNYITPFCKSIITFLVIAFLNDIISKCFNFPSILECFEVLKKSIVDLFNIIFRKPHAYINYNNLNNNYEEKSPGVSRQIIVKSKALQEYINLIKDRPDMFKEYNNISIVKPDEKGIKSIINYENVNNKNIGVVYKSDYNMMVVDLIKNKDGRCSTYERLVPTVQKGAVVVIPVYKNKFIILNQFRHAIRENQLAFPRGYGDIDKCGNNIEAESNAIKEIKEELGAEVIGRPQKLGCVIADSGISANKVMVYMVNIDKYEEKAGYEGIENILLKTEEELIESIKNGEITDGYTLSAYALYLNNINHNLTN